MAEKKDSRQIIMEVLRLEGAWRYIVPFVAYMFVGDVIRLLLPALEEVHIYISYAIRTLLVGLILWRIRHKFPELLKRHRIFDPTALLVGISIFAIWVGLEGLYPTFFNAQTHYDPTIFEGKLMIALILMRLVGSVLVAPVIEELFMRSFLMRYIINPTWEDIPVGTYTFESFAIVTLVFGFSHYRWLPGIITAILLNLLLYKKKNIVPCIVAHATANLFLLIYVVYTSSWFFY